MTQKNLSLAICSLILMNMLSRYNCASLTGSLTSYSDDESDRVVAQSSDVAHDQVVNTVVNINDSNSVALLNNFNVSKDEILKRLAQHQPITTMSSIDESSATTSDASLVNEQLE